MKENEKEIENELDNIEWFDPDAEVLAYLKSGDMQAVQRWLTERAEEGAGQFIPEGG
jgi:hypothetical protein